MGTENIGVQIEEPFCVMPLSVFCAGCEASVVEIMESYLGRIYQLPGQRAFGFWYQNPSRYLIRGLWKVCLNSNDIARTWKCMLNNLFVLRCLITLAMSWNYSISCNFLLKICSIITTINHVLGSYGILNVCIANEALISGNWSGNTNLLHISVQQTVWIFYNPVFLTLKLFKMVQVQRV